MLCRQIVAGRENARKVVQVLLENPELIFACDTEVAELDLQVTCAADMPIGFR